MTKDKKEKKKKTLKSTHTITLKHKPGRLSFPFTGSLLFSFTLYNFMCVYEVNAAFVLVK